LVRELLEDGLSLEGALCTTWFRWRWTLDWRGKTEQAISGEIYSVLLHKSLKQRSWQSLSWPQISQPWWNPHFQYNYLFLSWASWIQSALTFFLQDPHQYCAVRPNCTYIPPPFYIPTVRLIVLIHSAVAQAVRRHGFVPRSVHAELWWAKYHWDRVFSKIIRFSPVSIVPPWF
jgi:hypothetical protein